MQAASVRRMEEIVDGRPEEAAAVLKSWLNQDHP
jgi:flagellar biosynthesis/type III secretory pathway M-ring protein FliF/YscJ